MFTKKCRCGKTEKNFQIDIGQFFVDSCCLEAGYDDLGNMKKKDLDMTGLPSQDELEKEAADLKPDTSPEPEDPTEQTEEPTTETVNYEDLSPEQQAAVDAQAEGQPQTESVQENLTTQNEETPEQKKAREKAEKKAKKDAEKAAKKAAEQK